MRIPAKSFSFSLPPCRGLGSHAGTAGVLVRVNGEPAWLEMPPRVEAGRAAASGPVRPALSAAAPHGLGLAPRGRAGHQFPGLSRCEASWGGGSGAGWGQGAGNLVHTHLREASAET